jgi:hypothetical protein
VLNSRSPNGLIKAIGIHYHTLGLVFKMVHCLYVGLMVRVVHCSDLGLGAGGDSLNDFGFDGRQWFTA